MNRGIAWALASVLVAGVASAQPPNRSKELFERAGRAMDAGRYDEACPLLEESERLVPASGTEFNLGDCYEHTNRLFEASTLFARAAESATAMGRADRADRAKKREAALQPRLPRLVLMIASRAPGLVIEQNGERIDLARAGEPRVLPPGTYAIRASAPGKTPWTATATLVYDGAPSVVPVPELVSAPVPVVQARRAAPPPASDPQRTVAFVLAGAGVLAAGTGLVTGGAAWVNRQDAGYDHVERVNARAADFATASTISFAVAGVALVAAAVVWLTDPRAARRFAGGPALTLGM
jgi:hypothetical protein